MTKVLPVDKFLAFRIHRFPVQYGSGSYNHTGQEPRKSTGPSLPDEPSDTTNRDPFLWRSYTLTPPFVTQARRCPPSVTQSALQGLGVRIFCDTIGESARILTALETPGTVIARHRTAPTVNRSFLVK
jgi:hypothetical protein